MNPSTPFLVPSWGEQDGGQHTFGLRANGPLIGSRHLQEQRRNADGTLAVLMIVFALFCFIWAPVMLRRCRRHRGVPEDEINDLARFEAEARAVRATLQRMSMMGSSTNSIEERTTSERRDPHLEHRREFLDNALLTKKVIFQSQIEEKPEKVDDTEELDCEEETSDDDARNQPESSTQDSTSRKPPKRQKSNVIVLVNTIKHKKENNSPSTEQPEKNTESKEQSPAKDEENEPTQQSSSPQQQDSQLEPCSICLGEYNDGDEICWSHNEKCNHFFHKACIQTWLLTHEECPCCRQDFLCLWGDDDEEDDGRPRHTYTRSPSATSSLDWAEELAEEIQERILQRQRQLQAELERRERQQQMVQLHQQRSMPGTTRMAGRNTVISVDDLAAGFLLYRHFPMQFASDPRRLALSAALERSHNSNPDVEVAHFGMSHRLQPWQTYQPQLSTPNVFEMVDRSSRAHRQGEPQPRFFSTPALDTSRRRLFRFRPSTTTTTTAAAEGREAREATHNSTAADDDEEIITASA